MVRKKINVPRNDICYVWLNDFTIFFSNKWKKNFSTKTLTSYTYRIEEWEWSIYAIIAKEAKKIRIFIKKFKYTGEKMEYFFWNRNNNKIYVQYEKYFYRFKKLYQSIFSLSFSIFFWVNASKYKYEEKTVKFNSIWFRSICFDNNKTDVWKKII